MNFLVLLQLSVKDIFIVFCNTTLKFASQCGSKLTHNSFPYLIHKRHWRATHANVKSIRGMKPNCVEHLNTRNTQLRNV